MLVHLYSKPDCIFCSRAKIFFEAKGIAYKEKIVGEDISQKDYYEITKMSTVPAIYINDKLIGGYTELVEYAVENSEEFYG